MEMTCIVCPNGCSLEAEIVDGVLNVSGNKCKRGVDFAKRELTSPMRTVCTTVRTVNLSEPTVSVRTSDEIPRERIFDVIIAAKNAVVTKPIVIGDVVVKNLFGSGVDLIATQNIGGKEE